MDEIAVCSHSWRFDGDDPYIACIDCGERRDALSGNVVTAALSTEADSRPTPTRQETT